MGFHLFFVDRGIRLRLLAVIVIGSMLAALAATGPRAAAQSSTATFDWSIPDRFGLDRNSDGLIDYVDGASDYVTGYSATPSSWHVDLDACPLGGLRRQEGQRDAVAEHG